MLALLNGKRKRGTPIVPWSTTVLNNLLKSIFRKQKTESKKLRYLDPKKVENQPEASGISASDISGPLLPRDIEILGELNPSHRVIACCRANLWLCLPDGLWAQWLDEVHIEPPFPDDQYLGCRKAEQNAVLASRLGLLPNTVEVIIARMKPTLRRIRRLQERAEERQ